MLTLAVVHDTALAMGHVGDSRLYLAWNGSVRKLTSDHSPVGELEDSGALTEAQAMVAEVKGRVLLRGVRGQPPADEDALVRAIAALSVYAAAHAEAIESIDINPLLVLPRGRGVQALDALIVPRTD